jgi:hypothetical protein
MNSIINQLTRKRLFTQSSSFLNRNTLFQVKQKSNILSKSINKQQKRLLSTEKKIIDGKIAETTKVAEAEGMSFYIKYAPIIAPAVIYICTTTLICTTPYYRDIIEGYLPKYVEWVRGYHGFDDEDENDRIRVMRTIESEKESSDIIVLLNNGVSIEYNNIDGQSSYQEFEKSVLESNRDASIANISFKDQINNIVPNNDRDKDNNNNNDLDININYMNDDDDDVSHTLLESKSSLWDQIDENIPNNTSNDSKVDTKNTYGSGKLWFLQDKSNDNIFLENYITDAFLRRYQNFVLYTLGGYKRYQMGSNTNSYGNVQCSIIIKNNESKNKNINSNSNDVKKELVDSVNLKINNFQKEIERLEIEKVNGKREIDDIENDVKIIKTEIITLQRKYLNYFYFF